MKDFLLELQALLEKYDATFIGDTILIGLPKPEYTRLTHSYLDARTVPPPANR